MTALRDSRRVPDVETAAFSELNTMRLPWSARSISVVTTNEDLITTLTSLDRREGSHPVVAGELSNTVPFSFIDNDVVLYRGDSTIRSWLEGEHLLVEAGAGVKLDELVSHVVSRGYSGIELLSGIPGTVGGAVVQNAGAYGQSIADCFLSALALQASSPSTVTLSATDLAFGYRTSRLRSTVACTPTVILLSVRFAFSRKVPDQLLYVDLREFHAESDRDPRSVGDRRASVLDVRQRKGMVVGGGNWLPSVGSFFVGPVVDHSTAVEMARMIRGTAFAAKFLNWYRPDRKQVRLPAALALRAAGYMNGDDWGRVGLSPHHLLALCNRGNATGEDVFAVASLIQEDVRRVLGIELQVEPTFLGRLPGLDLAEYRAEHPREVGSGEPPWVREMGGPGHADGEGWVR